MSTHNLGFYEDLAKIITSSNIIKYAPYFFCCRNFKHRWLYSMVCVRPGWKHKRQVYLMVQLKCDVISGLSG